MPGIPAEVMFSFDSCVEAGDITSDVHAYLTLIDPDPVGWHDSLRGGDFVRQLSATSRQRMASWREKASMRDRAVVTWIGLGELPRLVTDSGRHVVTEAIKLRGTDMDGVRELVGDEGFVRDNAAPFIPAVNELGYRARDDIRLMGSQRFCDARADIPAFYRLIHARRMASAHEERAALGVGPKQLSEKKSIRKAKRKPIVKALDLLASIAGRQTASAFVSGDNILVTGRKFNFMARKGVLTSYGHGGLNLTVTDKNNIELVDLCFYFEDCPSPDQMASLIMHVKAGNEDQIVMTGNTIRSHAQAAHNPDLRDLQTRKARINEERFGNREHPAVAGLPLGDANQKRLGDLMGDHVDRVIFNGVPGGSKFYNANLGHLLPGVTDHIVALALDSRAGRFLTQNAPGMRELISTRKAARTDAVEIDLDTGQLVLDDAFCNVETPISFETMLTV
jgi:hypothetical protein